MVFSGKPYPFNSETGMNMILQWLNNTIKNKPFLPYYKRRIENSSWTDWTSYTVSKASNAGIKFSFNDDYIPVNDGFKSLYAMVKDVPGSKHFNDVIKSSCYRPKYSYLTYKYSYWQEMLATYAAMDTEVLVGGYTECLRCGKEEVMESASTMMCYDCELKYGNAENDAFCRCDHCGVRIIMEESRYVDDNTLCNDCFQQLTEHCEHCGDIYLKKNLFYNEVEDIYLCNWCRS